MQGERRAIAVLKICRKDRKSCLSHTLEINILAKIELVISRDKNIQSCRIKKVDHMGALVEARHQAWRQRVARMGAYESAILGARPFALRLYHCRVARHSAAPVRVFVDAVDIVDMEKR